MKNLLWGSFSGRYAIELSRDGLSIQKGAGKLRIAGNACEGAYIYKKEGYFYLFASVGSCCEGIKSTYKTVVGRSDKLFGPYLDPNGESMMDNKHNVVIHANDRFVGTGHNSEIILDDNGKTWIFTMQMIKPNPRDGY